METLAQSIAENYRTGKPIEVNPNNNITASRRKMYSHLNDYTGGDPESMYKYSMNVLSKYRPNIQRYVLSQGEVPNKDFNKMVQQAYDLRCKQIEHYSKASGLPQNEAQILLENEESDKEEIQNPDSNTFLGALAAPIGVAAHYIKHSADNFVGENPDNLDPALIMGLINTATAKINSSDLKRAAQNKPAGILGTLGTGGTSQYDSLRSFLQKPENAQIKQQILNGLITDVSQIPGFSPAQGGVNVLAQDAINQVKQQEIKKMIPYIIIGLIILTLVIVLLVRHHDRR
jgi:hypothetical protein